MKHLLKLSLQFFGDPEPGQQTEPEKQEEQILDPIEQLKKLRSETVPLERYRAMEAERNKLYSELANGHFTREEGGEKEETEDEKQQKFYKAIDTIYNHKFKGSNEFIKNALIIDDYLVSHGQRSAFAPSRGEITTDIQNNTEEFNSVLKDSLEAGDGDDTLCSVYFAKCINTPYPVGSRS